MAMATIPADQSKKTRIRVCTKKWTTREEIQVLKYLLTIVRNNLYLEKPSATVFYAKLLLEVPLNVTIAQIKAKVWNMRKLYSSAIQWKINTGADMESESVKNHITKICPHFDILSKIYGAKKETDNFSYKSDELVVMNPLEEDSVHFSSDAPIESNAIQQDGSSEEPSEDSEIHFEKFENTSKFKKLKPSISQYNSNSRKRKKNASDLISEFHKRRIEICSQKNELEKLKYESELLLKEKRLILEKEKFEFEKNIQLKEEENTKFKLEIEKQRVANNFKIEQEKLEIERAKLKIANK